MEKTENRVICPKCGKKGFSTRRYTLSCSYYPKKSSKYIDYLEIYEGWILRDSSRKSEEIQGINLATNTSNLDPIDMKVGDYVKMARKTISGNRYFDGRKEEDAYRVRYKKYYYYIGHYDATKYQKQMIDYKSGRRKSRPNGRVWCKLPKGIEINSLTRIA